MFGLASVRPLDVELQLHHPRLGRGGAVPAADLARLSAGVRGRAERQSRPRQPAAGTAQICERPVQHDAQSRRRGRHRGLRRDPQRPHQFPFPCDRVEPDAGQRRDDEARERGRAALRARSREASKPAIRRRSSSSGLLAYREASTWLTPTPFSPSWSPSSSPRCWFHSCATSAPRRSRRRLRTEANPARRGRSAPPGRCFACRLRAQTVIRARTAVSSICSRVPASTTTPRSSTA